MIYVVGIGPGNKQYMTNQAIEAINSSEYIVGYKTYIDLIQSMIENKKVVQNGMKQEVIRCKKAIDIAKEGKDVAVISSGDSGVYAMAGLILELISKESQHIDVEIIPGITASIAAAAVLGAPLMHDFCHISLSDLMTPWELIEKRLKLAAEGDFVICIYNPRSKGRPEHLKRAFEIMSEFKSDETPVGLVKKAGRDGEEKYIYNFKDMNFDLVDMTSVVIIGNQSSYIYKNKIITPRGYVL